MNILEKIRRAYEEGKISLLERRVLEAGFFFKIEPKVPYFFIHKGKLYSFTKKDYDRLMKKLKEAL